MERLFVTNRMVEIGESELQFTDQESNEFIQWLDPDFDERKIRFIQAKSQGWAAGMVLMARQVAISEESENLDEHCSIHSYLLMESWPSLSHPLQKFLVACALFSQFTAEMGKALTGYRQAKSDLDTLVSKNFLIERTLGAQPIYRIHPLFRDLLLTQIPRMFSSSEWQILQRKAAQILVQQDRAIEALSIYQQLQDWVVLKTLLLQQAQQLINTGRHRTILLWIKVLPDTELETDAWLSYWYAIALKPSDPLLAEKQLEKSYQRFISVHDIKGIYLAWINAIEAIAISWDDFSKLREWMSRFDEIRKNYSTGVTIELKIQFYATALQAFSIFNIQHPLSRSLIRICEGLFRFIPIKALKTGMSLQLAQYYMFNLQFTKAQSFFPYLQQALDDEALPTMIRVMSAYLLIVKSLLVADSIKGLEYTQKGLELSNKSGLYLFEGMLLANSVGCHINCGDLTNAENALQKAIDSRHDRQRIPIVMHHIYTVWLAALTNKRQYALDQNKQALHLAQLVHFEIAYAGIWSLEVQLQAELSQWHSAEQTLQLLAAAAQDANNKHTLVQYHVAAAWLGYLQHDELRMLLAVKELLGILRSENFFAFFGWRPKVFESLCLVAIENGIEQEYAIKLLKKHQLLTLPPVHLEQWPWSVRIYSFGTLEILVNGKPVEQSGKGQKKILELLEMLINLGGRDVHCDHLAVILWPDVEGDLARQSLETTLHRLRKLVGRETVLLNNSLLSLNPHLCWLDLWAFEATAVELEQALSVSGQQQIIDKLTDRLLKLYRGAFLKNNDSGLVILTQEQLLNKLSRLLDRVIDVYQASGAHERVRHLLHQQLEYKPLVENNYRRLMRHYANQGQLDEALQIYRQCQRVLCQGFNMQLSSDIQLLLKQIQSQIV
ncbi:BTAD domain-containing putative transcriptional regulator [Nitrosomonas sp. wSCUT-2]